MKVRVKHTSHIDRYSERFSSLSAFLMMPTPAPADTEQEEENGKGECVWEGLPFFVSYRTCEGRPCSLSFEENRLMIKRGFTEMLFEKGKVTSFLYRTDYGSLPMEVFTDSLSLQEKGKNRCISLSYYAFLGDMVQKNTMRFVISEEKIV